MTCPALSVRVSWDPRILPALASVHAPTVGGVRSASGSLMIGAPGYGAGLMVPDPLQLPTILVFAVPVVVMVPPPTMLMASLALELSKTPHPVVSALLPVMPIAEEAVGFRVITQPPPLATLAPLVERPVTVMFGNPRTAENSCGMVSETRAIT